MINHYKEKLLVLLLVLVALALWGGSYFRVFEKNELDALDLRFRLRPAIERTDQVVIVEIDNDTIKSLGLFPLDRGYHAKLVEALSRAGARAVVFDMFFSEPQRGDDEFRLAMRLAGNVYLPYVFELADSSDSAVPKAVRLAAQNQEKLARAARGTGYINVIPDSDGKFRRVPLFVDYQGRQYPSLAYQVGLDFLQRQAPVRKVPLDEQGNLLVNFAGPWADSFAHYSYADILQSYAAQSTPAAAAAAAGKPRLDLAVFKGKVCLVGLTADGTTDMHPSPLEPLYPSIGIHADIFNSLVNGKFITRASRWQNLGILFGLCALVVLACVKVSPALAFGILLEVAAIFLVIAYMLFNKLGLWIDVFYPLVVCAALYVVGLLYRSVLHFKEKIVLDNEFRLAKQIQDSFLPAELPAIAGVDVGALMLTAREVGGDLYDVNSSGANDLGVMIGDVMGKGFPASLFMAMAVSSFKFFAQPGVRPEKALWDLNEKIVREHTSDRFVTVFYSRFDLQRRVMQYANGGHMPVLYFGRGRPGVSLDVEDGLPLGMMNGVYSGGEKKFDPQDIFIYYTDGVTEAANSKGEMYGLERLSAFVEARREMDAHQLVQAIAQDVIRFRGKLKQQDDITLVAVKIKMSPDAN
ncbi:MAG: CHASE2 domain-containing protein [Candidatus Omnitrophica bacterium]|nr:CHASE2 domain-containing protein [Candidatus Omnitrophota bacterium]